MSEDIIMLYENVNPTMPKGAFVFIFSVFTSQSNQMAIGAAEKKSMEITQLRDNL